MGHNDHLVDLPDQAAGIAMQAGAISRCYAHNYVTINEGDPEANSKAYAIATNRWKAGEFACDREELMEAIKDAIDLAADECPACAKIRDHD